MERTSIKYLENCVERLNSILGRPATAGWTRSCDGKQGLTANVGHLYMETGGGSPRNYSLLEITNKAGGCTTIGGRGYRLAEFEAFLRGLLAALEQNPATVTKGIRLGY